MANALITGASGFIGSTLVKRLIDRGDTVRCLVRKTSKSQPLVDAGATLIYGDLASPRDDLSVALNNVDVVYHLAGVTKALSRSGYFDVNENGSERLYAACVKQPRPPVVIHISSLSAAGPTSADHPLVESDQPRPVSNYGESKLAGERVARRYADRVPITILRPPIVLGEGDLAGLDMFKGIARIGVHLQPVRTVEKYSVVHVADLSDLMILAAERGERIPAGREPENDTGRGIYHCASAPPMSYADLGHLIGNAVGRTRMRVVRTPAAITRLIGVMGTAVAKVRGKPVFLNFDKAHEATAGSWSCSAEKSRSQLGFSPSRPLSDRLRQTVEWYRGAGLL